MRTIGDAVQQYRFILILGKYITVFRFLDEGERLLNENKICVKAIVLRL